LRRAPSMAGMATVATRLRRVSFARRSSRSSRSNSRTRSHSSDVRPSPGTLRDRRQRRHRGAVLLGPRVVGSVLSTVQLPRRWRRSSSATIVRTRSGRRPQLRLCGCRAGVGRAPRSRRSASQRGEGRLHVPGSGRDHRGEAVGAPHPGGACRRRRYSAGGVSSESSSWSLWFSSRWRLSSLAVGCRAGWWGGSCGRSWRCGGRC
jgi:hypothetical protein